MWHKNGQNTKRMDCTCVERHAVLAPGVQRDKQVTFNTTGVQVKLSGVEMGQKHPVTVNQLQT